MNHFERTAVFTMIETIEAQLRGLKTLIAASSNATAPAAKSTSTIGEVDSHMMTDDEETALAQQIARSREKMVHGLAAEAQDVFSETLSGVVGGIPPPGVGN
jgi:hypothetical protein